MDIFASLHLETGRCTCMHWPDLCVVDFSEVLSSQQCTQVNSVGAGGQWAQPVRIEALDRASYPLVISVVVAELLSLLLLLAACLMRLFNCLLLPPLCVSPLLEAIWLKSSLASALPGWSVVDQVEGVLLHRSRYHISEGCFCKGAVPVLSARGNRF